MGVMSRMAVEMQEAGIGELCDSCGEISSEDNPAMVASQGYHVCEACISAGGQADDVGFSLNHDRLMAKDD